MDLLRSAIAAGFVLVAASMTAAPAKAAPSVPAIGVAPDGAITLVEGGCGPGGFRARNGYCYPRRPPPPPPPRYRGCPPGTHPTPYGCRRNW